MPKMPNVHIVLNSADGVGTYTDFQVANPGANMVQGMIKDVAVSEVQFPYDIPNVQEYYNEFQIGNDPGDPIQLQNTTIAVTPGFYTGTELAAAITAAIVAAGATNPTPMAATTLPSVTFSTTSNCFTWVDAVDVAYKQSWTLVVTFPNQLGANASPSVTKSLLSIMGIVDTLTSIHQLSDGLPVMGSAPLVFTQFIDITSRKLTRYQHLRDGSSSADKRRTDLVARVYVTNDTSTYSVDPPGTRPFVIHRQFKNQRVFDWTTDGSVDAIDLQLYDDYGSPLPYEWLPRPYQLTLHAYQNPKEESSENAGYRF